MKNKILLFIFLLGFLLMLGTTIWASLQQNLFTEFSWTGSPMWFKATLIDFYINQIIIWIFILAIEENLWVKIITFPLCIMFGSMTTALYFVYRILAKKPIFQRRVHD
jgi:hypothetical protein